MPDEKLSRPYLSERVYGHVAEYIGRVADNPSTITYELGTGGPTRQIIGYEIAPHTENDEPDFLSVLPLFGDGIGERNRMKLNRPGDEHMTLTVVARARIVTISVTAGFPAPEAEVDDA